MPASHGCSPPFILAGFISSARISDPLVHVLSSLLCIFFFFFDWACVWAGCLVWSSALCSSACVCLCVCTENERCIRWLYLRYSPPCLTITALIGLTVKPLVSIHCVAVIRYTISWAVCGREWRSVSLLQWRRGCCVFFFFFFLDRRQPGTQGDATPTKVYFNRFPGNIPAAWGSGASREHPRGSRLLWFPKITRWVRFLDGRSASCTIKMAKGALAQWAPLSSAASETRLRFIFHPASIQTCVFISCHPHDTSCPSTACSLLFRISKDLMCHLLARANVPRPPACRHNDVASSCSWYQPHHHKSFNLCNFLLTVYTIILLRYSYFVFYESRTFICWSNGGKTFCHVIKSEQTDRIWAYFKWLGTIQVTADTFHFIHLSTL